MPTHPSPPTAARATSLAALAAAVCLCASPAWSIDVWTTPNPGIRHLHRTTPAPAEFHALVVDLDTPGVQIRCTPPRERWKSTSAYARDANLAAAINGGFWGLFGQGAQGLAAGAGQVWGSDDEENGFFAVTEQGRAWVSPPPDVVAAGRRRMSEGVSGRPMIVDRGHLASELYTFPRTWSREPRTAVGVSENGRTVY
ncbi:MAG: phosphodiester glycosidase family protein, partial [Polyangiales bacterium]